MPDYPEDLDHPLTRGELSLLGVSWREISGPLWRSPYLGVHVWSQTEPDAPLQRALDASALLPAAGALGGWAAATVGGLAELDGGAGSARRPVPLCLPPQYLRRRGRSVVSWRSPLLSVDVTEVGGIAVTTPVRTAFDLVRHGPLVEAVTALDVLARGRPEFLDALAAYVEDRPRWRGVPQARAAIRLASPRARSPRETVLRLFWVLECGLPAPEVNACIRDGTGFLLGMGDLLDVSSGLLGEYDGGGHRQELQHAADNAREEDLEEGGLTVVRVTNLDLARHPARTKKRLLTGRRRALRTPRGDWTWSHGPMPPPARQW